MIIIMTRSSQWGGYCATLFSNPPTKGKVKVRISSIKVNYEIKSLNVTLTFATWTWFMRATNCLTDVNTFAKLFRNPSIEGQAIAKTCKVWRNDGKIDGQTGNYTFSFWVGRHYYIQSCLGHSITKSDISARYVRLILLLHGEVQRHLSSIDAMVIIWSYLLNSRKV